MLKFYDKSSAPALLDMLRRRSAGENPEIMATVNRVIDDVRTRGDEALYEYSEKFDGVKLSSLFMSEEEKERLIAMVPDDLRRTMERAAENIRAFHEQQKQTSWIDASEGRVMGQRVLPLRRVGIYVPGGRAAYPSSVLMNAIPASVAGVDEIIMCTPPKAEGVNPAVIYAAHLAGVKNILTVGGAQAVAALAYGTESIKRVDKIVGPGNIYVAMAKRLCYGAVDIDMIAGPSEVLCICDESANASYIAADLLSQAEHDPLAASVLITTSRKKAEEIDAELARQTDLLARREIIMQSISSFGSAVIVDTLDEAAALSDEIAPEHLELALESPFEMLSKIRNAGSVFLGHMTPEPLGDYMAGPNHVLPTGGTARFSSALSVDSFVKKSSYLYFGREAFNSLADDVIRFAEAEGLDAHANSVRIRK
ncbi:MAG: histidinol dehydrogenase [Clostridia bacterium]|nr:histidinol dehydrogenase [Clostridia bacterium]